MWFITGFFFGTAMGARIRMGKGTTRKLQNKIIIIYLTEMKGEKLQSKLPAQADLNHTGGRQNPKPCFGFVSSSLSSLLPPTPSPCCGCAVERRKEGEQEPTPTRAAANSCTAWALITDCPPITFLFCDLESPIYPLYIYLFSVLCELSRLLGFTGLKIGLWT